MTRQFDIILQYVLHVSLRFFMVLFGHLLVLFVFFFSFRLFLFFFLTQFLKNSTCYGWFNKIFLCRQTFPLFFCHKSHLFEIAPLFKIHCTKWNMFIKQAHVCNVGPDTQSQEIVYLCFFTVLYVSFWLFSAFFSVLFVFFSGSFRYFFGSFRFFPVYKFHRISVLTVVKLT